MLQFPHIVGTMLVSHIMRSWTCFVELGLFPCSEFPSQVSSLTKTGQGQCFPSGLDVVILTANTRQMNVKIDSVSKGNEKNMSIFDCVSVPSSWFMGCVTVSTVVGIKQWLAVRDGSRNGLT